MPDKYLATAVLTRRSTRKICKTARGFCRKFRFHRFAVLASSVDEVCDMVRAFAAGDWFRDRYETTSRRVCVAVSFPTGNDVRPVEHSNLYVHYGVVRGDRLLGAANYRTIVSASSPEIAEWIAMEAHLSRGVRGMRRPVEGGLTQCESYVLPCPGELVYLGESNLEEAQAIYRKTYLELADEAEAEAGAGPALTLEDEEEARRLFEELTESTRLCLPLAPTRDEIARAWVVEQSGDASARHMSDGSEDGERILRSFLDRMGNRMFQLHSHRCIGAGVDTISDEGIARAAKHNLLARVNA